MIPVLQEDILLVEDSPSLAATYMEFLKPLGLHVFHAASGAEALDFLSRTTPKVMLLDLKLPDMSGLEILDQVQERELPLHVIVITAHGSVEVSVDAMKKGAFDFILKPFNAERLTTTVRNALNHHKLREKVSVLEETLPRDGLGNFIGSSYPMQAVYQTIRNTSQSDVAIFITGESGTGKEVCAEAIHHMSKRSDKPFVALNCGAIPHNLLESEIFGHKKGAFTGAIANRDGAAQMANGGTLFLDEIGELDVELQIKLLRFIQTQSFRPVGGDKDIEVDIRFICATNRDPQQQVREGTFREDLYYRLNVIPLHMPPLRDREEDITELANAFLKRYAKRENKKFHEFTPNAHEILLNYSWPGNVRELQNIIQQIVVLHDAEDVTKDMLPIHLYSDAPPPLLEENAAPAPEMNGHKIQPLWTVEKDAIERTLEACSGNISRAAAYLEVSPSTIYRKMRGWGIDLENPGKVKT